jgi:hypothetical protein
MRRAALLGLLFLGSALLATAQDASPDAGSEAGGQAARRVLVFLSFAPDSSYGATQTVQIRESLYAAFASYRKSITAVEWPGEGAPDDRVRTLEALDYGCDSWLSVEITGSSDGAGYTARAFDLVTRKYPVDYELQLEQPLRSRDLRRRFWDEMLTELTDTLSVPDSGTRITFVGRPGTVIRGAGSAALTLDEEGRTTVELPNPNVYRFRATRLGYNPLTETLVVGDAPKTVVLEQARAPRHIVDVGLSTLSYPTASYGYYLLPNYIFAKIGFTSYVAGFYLLGETQEPSLWVSEPLTEFHLQLASFFSPADVEIRGYAGAVGGLRLMHSTFLFGLEPLAPFFFGPLLGVEFEPFASILGFVEWSPVMLLSDETRLLSSAFPAGYEPMAVTNFGIGLVDFLRYRVGVRFQW